MNVTCDQQAEQILDDVNRRYIDCDACLIGRLAFRKAFVCGTLPCKILFYGIGPGRRENSRGIPFIGDSGEVLDAMTYPLRAKRSKHRIAYALTNLIMCRPCDQIGGPNRDPSAEEIRNCKPIRELILKAARPIAIVKLGQLATRHLGKKYPRTLTLPHPSWILRCGGVNTVQFRDAQHQLLDFVWRLKHGKG